ncbi:hypothetical protein DPEC_G00202720 [Dallia pectoralis]|uniref:Uncharacterized protein n=1 Tax=Dallia pectoralis TaxID=75939 RepID=A0ACC2G9D2_DALPE|nr:hypothetical protein DPEC_G00202720 [Dallia pectoralis]
MIYAHPLGQTESKQRGGFPDQNRRRWLPSAKLREWKVSLMAKAGPWCAREGGGEPLCRLHQNCHIASRLALHPSPGGPHSGHCWAIGAFAVHISRPAKDV